MTDKLVISSARVVDLDQIAAVEKLDGMVKVRWSNGETELIADGDGGKMLFEVYQEGGR